MNPQHEAANKPTPLPAPTKQPTPEQAQRTALAIAHMRAQDRRFTGEPLTGFGDL